MIQWKLFEKSTIRSHLSYEKDLKIAALLQTFFDREHTARILKYFTYCGEPQEIISRQEFFRELTEEPDQRELLKTIRGLYRNVENAVILYKKQASQQDRDIWGIYLLEQYEEFVKNTIALNAAPASQIFRAFYQSIERVADSEVFRSLSARLEEVEVQYSGIRNMRIHADFMYAMIAAYQIEPGAHENIIDTLKALLSGMGIASEYRQSSYIQLDDLDLYSKYMSFIVARSPALKALIKQVNVQFESTLRTVTETDIEDVIFALECCELYDILNSRGISLCYPEISQENEIDLQDVMDITLLLQNKEIVPNDLTLSAAERIAFVAGANGGGKTSFMRAVGICCLFSSCGLFIPAKTGRLPLIKHILTLFPHHEELAQAGRFVTEKELAEKVLEAADSASIIIANELFSGTNERNGLENYRAYVPQLEERGARAFFVTHFPEVVKLFKEACYPVFACRTEADQATFQIVRNTECSSSVLQILQKYGLDQAGLTARFGGRDSD